MQVSWVNMNQSNYRLGLKATSLPGLSPVSHVNCGFPQLTHRCQASFLYPVIGVFRDNRFRSVSTAATFSQDLKQQADIVRIIGDYIPLEKAGAQNFTGLCPFHKEKTHSFSVHA